MIYAAKLAHTQALESRHRPAAAAQVLGSIERKAPALLLSGPHGCGKTTLCEALSTALFQASAVLWLDMTQLGGPAAAVQLAGPPAGTVGHHQGGLLTRLLRRHRSCLLVLENVEAAHASVLSLIASALLRGSLRDGHRNLDCTHMWVVATSAHHSMHHRGATTLASSPKSSAFGSIGGYVTRESAGASGSCSNSSTSNGNERKALEASEVEARASGSSSNQHAAVLLRGLQRIDLLELSGSERCDIARRRLLELSERLQLTHSVVLAWTDAAVKKVAAGGFCSAANSHSSASENSGLQDPVLGPGAREGHGLHARHEDANGHAVGRAVESVRACCWEVLANHSAGSGSREGSLHVDVVDGVLTCKREAGRGAGS